MNDKRPKLNAQIPAEIFKNFYWLKKELTDFCTSTGLGTTGLKPEIMKRIYIFLTTGKKPKTETIKNSKILDSDKPITPNTPVINYKNDPPTRDFFIKYIGPHFRFSARVNIFRKEQAVIGNKITYSDLIKAWLHEYEQRKDKAIKLPIMASCEYNQFTRDFYAAEPNAERKTVIAAWKKIRSVPGERTYAHWKKLQSFKS